MLKQKGAFISILPFSIGVGIAVSLFVLIHESKILSDVGFIAPNLLNTDRGKIQRRDPLFSELATINFPGYESILTKTSINLSEESQFASPTLLLGQGERIVFNIPRFLPFELAQKGSPQIVILGTSLTRDGLRSDILSREFGMDRVLNFSLSAARFTTIELVIDHLVETLQSPVDILFVAVNDVSLFKDEGETARWRNSLVHFRHQQTIIGKLDLLADQLWDHLPHLRRNKISQLSQPFKRCNDEISMAETINEKKNPLLLNVPPADAEQIAAIKRIFSKVTKVANRIIFLEMPTSRLHTWRMKNKPHRKILREILGEQFVSGELTEWDLGDWAFFGAKSLESCELDIVHLNPLAAINFTEVLARRFR